MIYLLVVPQGYYSFYIPWDCIDAFLVWVVFLVDTWLTKFWIDQICIVLQKGMFCMFKQVRSGLPKAIWSIQNSVNTGPMVFLR